MTQEGKKSFLINCLFIAVVGVIIYFVFDSLFIYIFPFAIGMLVSMAVQKPATTLHSRLKLPKGLCMVFLVVVVYVLVMLAIIFVSYGIYHWLSGIASTLPEIIPQLTNAVKIVSDNLSKLGEYLPEAFRKTMLEIPSTAISTAGSWLTGTLTDLATGIIAGIPSVILGVVITVIASAYIAKDYTKVVNFLGNQLPPRAWELVLSAKQIVFKNIFKMLRGYMFLMFITFVELSVFMFILGYRSNAFILAAAIAVIDILPVLGTGTILIPWGLISFIYGDFLSGALLLIFYLIITVVRNILEPKIIGHQVGIHPLFMLFVMFIGLNLFGLLGTAGLILLVVVISELQKAGKIHIWVTREEALRRKAAAKIKDTGSEL